MTAILPVILMLLCALPLRAAADEVSYELDQLDGRVAVLTVERAAKPLGVLSQDGRIFRLHQPGAVFIDRSPFQFSPAGPVAKVDQLRGADGVDLVMTFHEPVISDGDAVSGVTRFVFMPRDLAGENSDRTGAASGGDSEKKLAELRALVRELTLELLTLKKERPRGGREPNAAAQKVDSNGK
jgi:hypothetical protein